MKATDSIARRLIGAWRLERWSIEQPDGTVTEPFGADPEGLLLYTADGCMSATLMAAHRTPLSRANPRRAPQRERAAAFDSYFSYGGRWRVVAGRVHHEVTVALNPSMVGTVQVRDPRLTARTLTLSAVEKVDMGARTHRIRWRRVAVRSGRARASGRERTQR